MKKNFYIFFISTLLLSTKVYSQACSINIIPSDSLACSGDVITLNSLLNGPELSLMASNTAGNNHRGNMFDIVAGANDVTILRFDASPMGNTTIEIYYKVGTWNGFANTPSAWTFVGSAPTPYTGGFSAVNVPVNITIPAGQTYAFYVTSNSTAVSLNYSNGTAVGNIYSSDPNISFLEGGGMEYPFTQGTGAVYQPRIWNGNIYYSLANQPSMTYLWGTGEATSSINDTIVNATQYTIQANAAGCPTMYDTFTVAVSIPLVDAGANQAICYGDQTLLYGTGAVSYVWDNSVIDSVTFIPTNTVTYHVTGTDTAGCTNTDSVTININSLPIVDAGTDYGICDGDTTTLFGQGADTYSWNNGVADNVPFQPTGTDTYIVVGTDLNGCENSDTITVFVNNLPNVSAGTDQIACAGIQYTLNGAGAVSYTWNNGVTDGVPFTPAYGDYIVTGTDANGCVNKDTMFFNVITVPTPIGNAGTTLITAFTPGTTIQWVNCSDYAPIPGATNFTYTPTGSGNYAVILTNEMGCYDTSSCVFIDFIGIEEELAAEISVYPIPTNGKIVIASTGAEIQRVELTDMLGQVLMSVEPNASQTEMDLSNYSANTFFVRIFREGHTSVVKVLKN